MKQIKVLETMKIEFNTPKKKKKKKKERKEKTIFFEDVAFQQPSYITRLEDAPVNRCQCIFYFTRMMLVLTPMHGFFFIKLAQGFNSSPR